MSRINRAKMTRHSLYIEDSTWELLERQSLRHGTAISHLIRDYLREKTEEKELKSGKVEQLRLNEVRKKNEIQQAANRANPHVYG